MQTVEQSLIKMKRDIQSKENERLVNAMRRASLGLLRLSQEQEKLMQSLKNGEITGTQAEEKQITLSKNVDHRADSLYQLSQETFFITPDIGKSLGEAKSAMQQALENLNSADYGKAQNFQGKAMGSLNQALISMLRDMDNFSQNSGSGMEQFFLQLQKMGEEQAAINRKMMDMLGKGILSLEDQAGMARLVAEQESLKQRLQELVKEYGNRSNIAGNLNNLVKEMEELVQEMKNQNADRRTIQTQERILSRLLEAQHSLYLQDFSQKRQAKVGKDKILQSPPLGGFGMSQTLERFRKDLLRAEKEGYTKDYLELILRYFKALSNSDSNY
jgi:regulator of replication initiation timing